MVMPVISPLSYEIINKISAGEVIESPVSVVKELLDNSLDAKSTKIEISLEDYGFKLIKLADNGIGMAPEDLRVCCLPHYTSKITSAQDLVNIKTLGFRGEALSSICAIADVEITSSLSDQQMGSKIFVSRNVVTDVNNTSSSKGTSVVIKNLFIHTPVRKKFLKDEKRYYKELLRLVSAYAACYPEVAFVLNHNSRNVLNFPSRKNVKSRLVDVFGKEYLTDFLPVTSSTEYFKIEGYIGKPQRSSYNTHSQYLFINGRPVSSDTISKAAKEAFAHLLEPRLQPDFIFSLQVPYDLVDVNVHPKKETVAFWNEKLIFEEFLDVIKKTLGGVSLKQNYKTDNDLPGYVFHKLKDSVGKWTPGDDDEIFQAGDVYLIKDTKEGVLIVDQHAAHESVLYEQYLREYKMRRSRKEIFVFPEPLVFSLPPAKFESLSEDIYILQELGFDVEVFGGKSFRVTAVPVLFKDHNIPELFDEMLSSENTNYSDVSVDAKTNKVLQYLACRGAVKAGDYLSPEERKSLIEKLSTEVSYNACPHGRPTQVLLSFSELDKMFKRRK
jgi:DNA mismatch repair protein MutL